MTAVLALALTVGVFAADEAVTDTTTIGATEQAPKLLSLIFSGGALAIIGAALAVGLAGIGSAKGVGMAGEATAGILSENPNLFGKCFVLMALPMTQGIYGLVIAFLIVMKAGLFEGGMEAILSLSVAQGAYYLMAALPIAAVGLISALKQARVAVAGINLLSKRPDQVGKAITSAALVETYAIFALLISVLLVLLG
ncbi:MAG: V-type ATP synthase subunit K [Clostridia bacterium]|nr:V-type ATP synthase subunit K [Clostridia bacterium]MBQ2256616.1 V-type ATP synthase subunit K [Clostridia bacterium]MBQ5362907.1 V-type ATP synthase subunit K [Clostridia bacterium]MBQ5793625.1 V-type ATP synthase subunit K [Clostridia bacterium]